jgi:hypothetical protein
MLEPSTVISLLVPLLPVTSRIRRWVSFRAAQRLSPGEHSSLLYMGMEYVRTNHLVLAQYFLESALSTSGGDPLCSHELGVLASLKGDHGASISFLQRALAAIVGGDSIEETIDMSHDPYCTGNRRYSIWDTAFAREDSFHKRKSVSNDACLYAPINFRPMRRLRLPSII